MSNRKKTKIARRVQYLAADHTHPDYEGAHPLPVGSNLGYKGFRVADNKTIAPRRPNRSAWGPR